VTLGLVLLGRRARRNDLAPAQQKLLPGGRRDRLRAFESLVVNQVQVQHRFQTARLGHRVEHEPRNEILFLRAVTLLLDEPNRPDGRERNRLDRHVRAMGAFFGTIGDQTTRAADARQRHVRFLEL